MKLNPLSYWEGKKRPDMLGEKHPLWKGENAGYEAIHGWVKNMLGRPKLCEHCGTKTAKKFEWANKDHSYKRNIEDWIRLCTKCHRAYDYRFNEK